MNDLVFASILFGLMIITVGFLADIVKDSKHDDNKNQV